MQAQDHLKAAPILGALYFVGGLESVVIAIIASILIDLDHLHLIIREKTFTVKKIIELSQNIYGQDSIKRCFEDVTYALHSIEINILLIVLAYYFYLPLAYIAMGFIFHIICDIIHHRRQKLPIIPWLILTTYFIRLLKNKNT
jgi:hypothetical protein